MSGSYGFYWHSSTPDQLYSFDNSATTLAFGMSYNNLHNSWGHTQFNRLGQDEVLFAARMAMDPSFDLRYAMVSNDGGRKGGDQWDPSTSWNYTVQPGDTYYGIANRIFGGTVTPEQLGEWNYYEPTKLPVGAKIVITDPYTINERYREHLVSQRPWYYDSNHENWQHLGNAGIGVFNLIYGLITGHFIDPFVPGVPIVVPEEQ